jgi:hypothetical protein
VQDLKAGSLKEVELREENGIANMKYKPFTSKHCTPSRFTSPLKQTIDSDAVERQTQGELVDFDSTAPGMQEYKAHQANMPQYTPGSSIGDKFNTTMKRVVHNLTGPKNPNLVGGTMSAGAAGRAGIAKGLIKLGAKAIKKYKESK